MMLILVQSGTEKVRMASERKQKQVFTWLVVPVWGCHVSGRLLKARCTLTRGFG